MFGGITPALAIAAACHSAGVKVLAGVARSRAGLQVAQALAATTAFAGHVDVQAAADAAAPAEMQTLAAHSTAGTPDVAGSRQIIAERVLVADRSAVEIRRVRHGHWRQGWCLKSALVIL